MALIRRRKTARTKDFKQPAGDRGSLLDLLQAVLIIFLCTPCTKEAKWISKYTTRVWGEYSAFRQVPIAQRLSDPNSLPYSPRALPLFHNPPNTTDCSELAQIYFTTYIRPTRYARIFLNLVCATM